MVLHGIAVRMGSWARQDDANDTPQSVCEFQDWFHLKWLKANPGLSKFTENEESHIFCLGIIRIVLLSLFS